MMFGRARLAATLATCVLALAPFTATLADSHAAKVLFAAGEVSAIDPGGTRRTVSRGELIGSGETVVTGEGRAQLKLTDGGFVALDARTEYVIEAYRYDAAAPGEGRSFFNLVRGGVRFVTGAIGKVQRANWRMRTAVATIGIRGTSAYARYGSSLAELFVDVSEGSLEATDPDTGAVSVLEQGGRYRCSSPCEPLNGPGGDALAPDFPAQEPAYRSGEDTSTLGPRPEHHHEIPSQRAPEPGPGHY